MRIIQTLAICLLVIGCVVLFLFLNKASVDGFTIANSIKTDYQVTGQFGDFVGGVVGTFFALSGTLLIFLNFKEQTKENKRSGFESSFFEMIRLYRENVSELKYRKPQKNEVANYENRQVLRAISSEFIECYREVKKFSNSQDIKHYFNPTYAKKLKAITDKINPEIDIIEMAIIDLAYMIVFYGLSPEGEQIIKDNIIRKYSKDYYYKLLHYIKLKPKDPNSAAFDKWLQLKSLNHKAFHIIIDELYAARNNPTQIKTTHELAEGFALTPIYEKYYDGHQFRLGHYFRHLYQSFKYLNNHQDISRKEKYEYGKMYRAQFSTDEQILIFVNSLSCLGMNWELTPESPNSKENATSLITNYNLIKNLPGTHLSGIKYKTYYKNVKYESDEQILH